MPTHGACGTRPHHRCPPCRAFTPILTEAYNEVNKTNKRLEIVFVTSDRDLHAQIEYMRVAHGPWLTIAFGDPNIAILKRKYSVTSVPTLVMIRSDGTVIEAAARGAVQRDGARAFPAWLPAA